MNLTTLMSTFEWIGTLLTLISAIYICIIAKVTGWFKAWTILAVAFFLIVVRRIIAIFATNSSFVNYKSLLLQTNSVLLLVLGILYVTSFYMLYQIFKRKIKSK
jgi:hypothetical protein